MIKLSIYSETDLENKWLQDNLNIFGDRNNDFQEGFGYGYPRESVYSNDTGDGYGFGTSDGKGCDLYPHALVQYWEDK